MDKPRSSVAVIAARFQGRDLGGKRGCRTVARSWSARHRERTFPEQNLGSTQYDQVQRIFPPAAGVAENPAVPRVHPERPDQDRDEGGRDLAGANAEHEQYAADRL